VSLFTFRALDSQGVTQRGTLQAKDQSAAIAILHKRGWLLLQIDAAGRQGLRHALQRGPLTGAALVSFTQQLATLLGAVSRWNVPWACCSSSPASLKCVY